MNVTVGRCKVPLWFHLRGKPFPATVHTTGHIYRRTFNARKYPLIGDARRVGGIRFPALYRKLKGVPQEARTSPGARQSPSLISRDAPPQISTFIAATTSQTMAGAPRFSFRNYLFTESNRQGDLSDSDRGCGSLIPL